MTQSCQEIHPSAKVDSPIIETDTAVDASELKGEVISSTMYPAVLIHDHLVDIESSGILFEKEMPYATETNISGKKLYPCEKCFLRSWVAEAMIEIQNELIAKGYYLKIFDCYRPHSVQKELWDNASNKNYVANPIKGSMHNRGMAVDVTITDKNLTELDMGSEYDELGYSSHEDYPNLSLEQKENRHLLQSVMLKHGFKGIHNEWWHFSYDKKGRHPMLDLFWECD